MTDIDHPGERRSRVFRQSTGRKSSQTTCLRARDTHKLPLVARLSDKYFQRRAWSIAFLFQINLGRELIFFGKNSLAEKLREV